MDNTENITEITVNNNLTVNMDNNFKVVITLVDGSLIMSVYQNGVLKTKCLSNQTEFNSIH